MIDIVTKIPSSCFCTQLDNISIKTDAERVECTIYRNTFSLVVVAYTVGGVARFCDIGKAIGDDLVASYEPIAHYVMEFSAGNEAIEYQTDCAYSAFNFGRASFKQYVKMRFLTSQTSKYLYANIAEELNLLALAGESTVMHVDATLKDGSSVSFDGLTHTKLENVGGTDYQHIIIIVDAKELDERAGGEVAIATVTVGSRSIVYYRTQRTDTAFKFRNAWNVLEMLPLFAITKAKTEVSAELANIGNASLLYDRYTERTYTVNTAAIPNDYETLIEQFVSSPYIELYSPVGDSYEILITDSDCQFSNDPESQNRLEFTWRFADNQPKPYPDKIQIGGVFTEQFNQVYG